MPVYAGERLVELCDPSRAAVLAAGSNVEVVRARKSKTIVRINIRALIADDCSDDSGAGRGDLKFTYDDDGIAGHLLTTLKRFDAKTQRFVRWDDSDAFDPRRFNPDRLPVPSRYGAQGC